MNEAVFTYTNLLPTSALNPDAENRSYWSSGEDQLLVLAMEDAESTSTQDGSLPSKAKKESAFVAACKHVHNSFMKVHLFYYAHIDTVSNLAVLLSVLGR